MRSGWVFLTLVACYVGVWFLLEPLANIFVPPSARDFFVAMGTLVLIMGALITVPLLVALTVRRDNDVGILYYEVIDALHAELTTNKVLREQVRAMARAMARQELERLGLIKTKRVTPSRWDRLRERFSSSS